MNLWTVIFKTVARVNTLGEYPYQVRAWDEAEAIEKARAVHQEKHPRNRGILRVQEVVLWAAAS